MCSIRLLLSFCLPFLRILTYAISPCHDSCDICLNSDAFSQGTYRIQESGKYCLSENIEFNPLPGDIDSPNSKFNWFPDDESLYPACETLKNGAFALGFFTAITIETDDIEIDLNGFEISQHLYFYIEQRFFSNIEIGVSPFLGNTGPTNFGTTQSINNIYIHNGSLGLSSHHGIHSNGATNVKIENMKIYDFEVAGIQFNGFRSVQIINVDIGPSSTNVLPSGYYSNAKYLSLAMNKLLFAIVANDENPTDKTITFSTNREVSVLEMYKNLLDSMDIAFRHFIDESSDDDMNHELYSISRVLYENKSKLPDGATLYGLVMHSFNVAVLGFGNFKNGAGDGEDVLLDNVYIHDLKNSLNEIPAVYFDECDDVQTKTPLKGPFADVLDVRKMVGANNMDIIDQGDEKYMELQYIGNPLSDAQVAIALYGSQYDALDFGSQGMDTHSHFLQWALEQYEGKHYETLPQCTQFMCNGDIMLHTNKGIIGARFDLIENVVINGLEISNLYNKSPISSFACNNYTGEHDGGSQGQLDLEGSMGTDVVALTVYGGDVLFEGNNIFDAIKSDYGSAVGFHLMHDAVVEIDDDANIEITSSNIISGRSVDEDTLIELIKDNKYPYPNNFYECNILLDENENDNVVLSPNPPNGVQSIFCRQNAVAESLGIELNVQEPTPNPTKKPTSDTKGIWMYNRYNYRNKGKRSSSSSSSSSTSSSSASSSSISDRYEIKDRFQW